MALGLRVETWPQAGSVPVAPGSETARPDVPDGPTLACVEQMALRLHLTGRLAPPSQSQRGLSGCLSGASGRVRQKTFLNPGRGRLVSSALEFASLPLSVPDSTCSIGLWNGRAP
jgi:hypothetical protein